MKKLLILMFVFIGSISELYCQILNQDASGQSAIVAEGTAINLNITQTQIQISHYGVSGKPSDFLTNDRKNLLWGFDLQAKNQTGIGNIFNNGNFTPDGSLSAIIGFRQIKFFFANNNIVTYDQVVNSELKKKIGQAYQKEVTKLVDSTALPNMVKTTTESELQNLDEKGIGNLPEALTEYKSSIKDTDQLVVINQIVKQLKDWIKNNPDIKQYIALDTQFKKQNSKQYIPNTTLYWYLRGGTGASQFTYDNGKAFSDFGKRFKDTTSVSFYIELGNSYQWKKNFLGFDLGFSRLSNMDALTSADYTYNYQDSSLTSGKLTKQKTFTAYSGKYGFYNKIYLNFDYQHLVNLESSKYLSFGPYLRWNNPLNASQLEKESTILGISCNYLDGKAGRFLGGIYLQSNDISGQTQPLFNKTIQFGLIAKFSLSSIFIMQ